MVVIAYDVRSDMDGSIPFTIDDLEIRIALWVALPGDCPVGDIRRTVCRPAPTSDVGFAIIAFFLRCARLSQDRARATGSAGAG